MGNGRLGTAGRVINNSGQPVFVVWSGEGGKKFGVLPSGGDTQKLFPDTDIDFITPVPENLSDDVLCGVHVALARGKYDAFKLWDGHKVTIDKELSPGTDDGITVETNGSAVSVSAVLNGVASLTGREKGWQEIQTWNETPVGKVAGVAENIDISQKLEDSPTATLDQTPKL